MKNNEFYVDVGDGIKYYLVERYEGTAISQKVILLLHGAGSGYVLWDIKIKDYDMMDYLAKKGFAVYAVDMRGFGKSTMTSGTDVRAETCAEDVKRVMDFIKRRMAVNKIHLAGGSWGSIVARVYAAKYPTDLEKLALMSPPYREMSDFGKALVQPTADLVSRGQGYYPNVLDPRKIANELHSSDQEVLSYFAKLCTSHCPNNPTGARLDLIQRMKGEQLLHDHYTPLITVPTLVITGAKDNLCPAENAQRLYQDLETQNKKMVVIPNAWHQVFLEREAHLANMEGLYDWFKEGIS